LEEEGMFTGVQKIFFFLNQNKNLQEANPSYIRQVQKINQGRAAG